MRRRKEYQAPKVDPVQHAKAMVRAQGYEKAQRIADGCVNLDTASLFSSDILPELKDTTRVARTNSFWKNVAAYMRKNLDPARKKEAANVVGN